MIKLSTILISCQFQHRHLHCKSKEFVLFILFFSSDGAWNVAAANHDTCPVQMPVCAKVKKLHLLQTFRRLPSFSGQRSLSLPGEAKLVPILPSVSFLWKAFQLNVKNMKEQKTLQRGPLRMIWHDFSTLLQHEKQKPGWSKSAHCHTFLCLLQ